MHFCSSENFMVGCGGGSGHGGSVHRLVSLFAVDCIGGGGGGGSDARPSDLIEEQRSQTKNERNGA